MATGRSYIHLLSDQFFFDFDSSRFEAQLIGDMASPECSIIDAEEITNSIVDVEEKKIRSREPSIQDYFEEINAIDRKCRLCSSTIKYFDGKGCANMRRHLKALHFMEWTKIEPFIKTRKSRVRFRKR